MSIWLLVIMWVVTVNLWIYVLGVGETRRINAYAKTHGRTPIPTYITVTSTAPIAYSALLTLNLAIIMSRLFKFNLSVPTRTFFVQLTMFLIVITTGIFQFMFSLVRNVGMLVRT